MSKLIKLFNFDSLGDDRGDLVALESKRSAQIDFKRVYYIFNTAKNVSRGFHAHKELQQLAVVLNGSCRFVIDDGSHREEILLDNPKKGILIDTMQWHEMHDFSEDCVLMVLANDYYKESDYIRNYQQFLLEVANNVCAPIK